MMQITYISIEHVEQHNCSNGDNVEDNCEEQKAWNEVNVYDFFSIFHPLHTITSFSKIINFPPLKTKHPVLKQTKNKTNQKKTTTKTHTYQMTYIN